MINHKIKIVNFFTKFAIISSLASVANAELSSGGLLVEPSVTYEMGNSSVNYPSPLANSTGSQVGLGLGARLGFHLNEAFFVGMDFRYSMPRFKDSSVNYDATAISTNWGPVVGMQMPNIGMRIWGSYILEGELNPEKSSNFDIKFSHAAGYRVGAGFRLTAVSLNIEYQQFKYGNAKLEQIGPFSPDATFNNVDLTNHSWIASLSFPLEF